MRSAVHNVFAGTATRDASPMRRAFAVLAAMMVALMGVVAMPINAAANPNGDIVVDSIVIGEGSGEGGQLIVGDTVAVTGTWDASEAQPVVGDTFMIGLPPELGFETDLPINLMGETPAGENVTWATCLTDSASDEVLCTLTDAVTDYPENVHGTFLFEVEVVGTTTADEVIFNLNGIDTPVTVPGEGGISDGIELPDEWTKSGWMNANNWSMTWEIELPGSRLQGNESITIRDTLGAGHQLCDPTGLYVQTARGDTVGGFTGSVEVIPVSDQVFDIVLGEPADGFDPNLLYQIRYTTCTPDGQIDPVDTE